MSSSETVPPANSIRLKDVHGVFILGPDDVEFRMGTLSGSACVLSDPERRGLLGPVIARIISTGTTPRRPWNGAETELLKEFMPDLVSIGIVEIEGAPPTHGAGHIGGATPILRTAIQDARIGIVGHGVLGETVRSLLVDMPCRAVTVWESSSVAPSGKRVDPSGPGPRTHGATAWNEIIGGHDWVIAAQDSFEPEELAALNCAALHASIPWSLLCFDGYEGWVGPTFVPGQTACFDCFQRRLLAGAGEPRHVFANSDVKVHRVPAPWSLGPETGAWISLISSIFALELTGLAQGRSFTLNQMLIVHRLNMTFQRESVLRLPRCQTCSPRHGAPAMNVFSHILGTRLNHE